MLGVAGIRPNAPVSPTPRSVSRLMPACQHVFGGFDRRLPFAAVAFAIGHDHAVFGAFGAHRAHPVIDGARAEAEFHPHPVADPGLHQIVIGVLTERRLALDLLAVLEVDVEQAERFVELLGDDVVQRRIDLIEDVRGHSGDRRLRGLDEFLRQLLELLNGRIDHLLDVVERIERPQE